jgi:hypothetical protein
MDHVSSADSAPRTTAGSRQPLLLENADAVGDMPFRTSEYATHCTLTPAAPATSAAAIRPPLHLRTNGGCADGSRFVPHTAPRTTAGSRQPLLVARRPRWLTPAACAKCSPISHSRCTHAHPTKSGGRQPAVRRRTERCAANITHCSPTTRRTNKSGGRQPAVVLRRQPSWRESDFLAGEWPTVRSNRSRKSPASLMLDAVEMR